MQRRVAYGQRRRQLPVTREKSARFPVAGSLDTYSLPEGRAHVGPGEAPTYVNAQRVPLQAMPASGSSAESSPRKDLFDMSGFPSACGFPVF